MSQHQLSSVFFFQAEDGIRDTSVTGVQTCALPIVKRGGADFAVPLPNGGPGTPSPEQALASRAPDAPRQAFALDGAGTVAAASRPTEKGVRVWLVSDAGAPLVLHWGLASRFRSEW